MINFLQSQCYIHIRHIEGRGWCGIQRMIYTTALCYGMDEMGIKGRWCYPTMAEAAKALEEWSGVGDPSGDWIKYKGEGGEYGNLDLKKLEEKLDAVLRKETPESLSEWLEVKRKI